MEIKGIDGVPMFSWNTETKELYVFGAKMEGINSVEDFVLYFCKLQQENERLNKVRKIYEQGRYQEHLDYEDYKSRCEKAIEYINNFSIDKSFSFPLMPRWEEREVKASIEYEFNDTLKKDLINILRGSDKNENI